MTGAPGGVEALKEALRAADDMRQAIRRAGVKRHPELYQSVMRYDAIRAIADLDEAG